MAQFLHLFPMAQFLPILLVLAVVYRLAELAIVVDPPKPDIGRPIQPKPEDWEYRSVLDSVYAQPLIRTNRSDESFRLSRHVRLCEH